MFPFLLTIIKRAIAKLFKLKIVSRIVFQYHTLVMVEMRLNLPLNQKRIVKYGLNAFNPAGSDLNWNVAKNKILFYFKVTIVYYQ